MEDTIIFGVSDEFKLPIKGLPHHLYKKDELGMRGYKER